VLFPSKRHQSAAHYAGAYFAEYARAVAEIDSDSLDRAAALIRETVEARHWIYVCGNGGSAAISNHLLCDFAKGIQTDTELRPRVMSLPANIEMVTAIANDIAYDEIFAYQLRTLAGPGDLLITISSSGDSENIVKTINCARELGMRTIALTGFDGGRSARMAEVTLHVPARNYGVVEDAHQSIMHILAQYIRQSLVAVAKFGNCKF
jgi:phosphoheptose isomerase